MDFNRYSRLTIALLGCILGLSACTPRLPQRLNASTGATTFYIVRHAEKELGSAPGLTAQGASRAQFYVDFFEDIQIDQVYSTPTRRTIETATPLAESKNLSVVEYANGLDFQSFTQELLTTFSGETVFMVGHNNTVPLLVNGLLGRDEYADIPHDDYTRLYQVVKLGESSTTVTRFKIPIAGDEVHE